MMRICSHHSLLISILALSAFPSTHAANAQSPASRQSDLVLHVQIRRVPLDIVVTDKKGNPVRGLKKDDFIIEEDGKRQKALSFEYLDASATTFVPPKVGPLPPNTFINLPSGPERGPLYILYYDMVNTPITRQMEAHHQLLDFIEHAPPGTRFALFANIAGLKLVQGFTSDQKVMKAAVLSQGPGPHLPKAFLYGSVYGFEDAGAALSNLRFIAEYMRGIRGRKNLFWLSSEFPIPVGPTMNGHNSNNGVAGGFSSSTLQINDLTYLLRDGIKQTYAALASSQVALYPIDLNGVDAGGDVVGNYQHEDDIAAATGGHAFYGNNRLAEILDHAVESGANYYSLTYSPSNTKYDGSERHIAVTVAKNKNYTLSYRTLYYGVPDEGPGPRAHDAEVLQARFVAAKQADNLYANIEHGAPMLHDLIFTVHVETEGAPALATPDQMLQLADTPAYFRTRFREKPPKAPAPVKLQKYRIQYQVIDSQLRSTAKRKGVQPVLEFAAAAYDPDGRSLNGLLNEGRAMPETNHAPRTSFRGEQEFEVPPGAAWLRVAVRDKLNDRTGTCEIPLPLKPEPTTPQPGNGR